MMSTTERPILESRQMSESNSVYTTNAYMCYVDRMKCAHRALVDRFATPIVSMNFLQEPMIRLVTCLHRTNRRKGYEY